MLAKIQPKRKNKEACFNYSLPQMNKALSSPKSKVPRIKDTKDLEAWLNS